VVRGGTYLYQGRAVGKAALVATEGHRRTAPALIELDGTGTKSRLGANAVIGVS
jgi:enolase